MKKLLLILTIVFLSNICCYAEITYEKINESVVKITETKTITATDQTTIADLKRKKAELEYAKVATLNQYNDAIKRINEGMVTIDKMIEETKKAGVSEVIAEPIAKPVK